MNRTPKIFILLCLVISLCFQTGCWDQKIYERIGFILQMGLDLDESNQLTYTITVPIIGPESSKGKVEVFTTKENLLRAAREKVRHVSGKAVESGKTQHLYFSKQVAEKGIFQYFDVFLRHSENPLLANVIIVDGSPQEMMKKSVEFEGKPMPAFYVNDLITNARQNSYIPETRIDDFCILYFSKTIDPITPMIRLKEKQLEVAGTALFNEDKMVGQIDTHTSGILQMLMGRKNKIQYMYHDKNNSSDKIKEGIAVLIKDLNRKIKINLENETPKVEFRYNLKAYLDEFSDENKLDEHDFKKMYEKQVAQSIQSECMDLLEYLKKIDSDPIGIGEILRSKHNVYWKSIKWKDIYRTIDFNVQVNLTFESHGALN